MNSKHLHIISFDVPYPANYGGIIDVYHKIKALHALNVKVHLHCFVYGKSKVILHKELATICENVYYYKRNTNKTLLFKTVPYIVVSRSSELMIENLMKNSYPILFEGLHTCLYLNDKRLNNRIKIVRTHNIEHHYYQGLANAEKSIIKKYYFIEEAEKLKRFEHVLSYANHIVAISAADAKELSTRYNSVSYIGAFTPYNRVSIKKGKGNYCLYHGNLSVIENSTAALYLIKNVFSKIQIPLIIAGSNPKHELRKEVSKYDHIKLVKNPDDATMHELIQNAQVNVLPTFQSTGIKLKLLAALFNGRHCLVNDFMVENTGLKELCTVKNTPEEMISAIEHLFELPVDNELEKERERVLFNHFSNMRNAEKIIALS